MTPASGWVLCGWFGGVLARKVGAHVIALVLVVFRRDADLYDIPLRPRTATGDGCIARLGGVFNRLLYALISLRKRRDNILHDTVHFVGRVNWCGDPWLCP